LIMLVFLFMSFFCLGTGAAASTFRTENATEKLMRVRQAIKEKGAKWEAGMTTMAIVAEHEGMPPGIIMDGLPDSGYGTGDAGRGGVSLLGSGLQEPPAFTEFDWHDRDGTDWMTRIKMQSMCRIDGELYEIPPEECESMGGEYMSCGSCWAFAVVAIVEAKFNIFTNDPDLDLDLAEQQLVSSCFTYGDCGGLNVNDIETPFEYIRNVGIVDEECFPYRSRGSPCSLCVDWEEKLSFIEGFGKAYADTTEAYKAALVEHGPMLVALEAHGDFLFYKGGVYEPVLDDESYGWANHAVALTGYNDSGQYWIIKNSWGTDWGENGYGKVGYGVLEQYGVAYYIESVRSLVRMALKTDRAVYDPLETIMLNGTVTHENSPVSAEVNISFLDPEGREIGTKTVTSVAGEFSAEFGVPADAEAGMYSFFAVVSYAGTSATATEKVKIGSLVIDLNETARSILFNTTHEIRGYVRYPGGQGVADAWINATVLKGGQIQQNLSCRADSGGHFVIPWEPGGFGEFVIVVKARDPATNKVGFESIDFTENPPKPGQLRLLLTDVEGMFIYDGNYGDCPYSPSTGWYDVRAHIYNESGFLVKYDRDMSCEEAFNLTEGTYMVEVEGRPTPYHNYMSLIREEVDVILDKQVTLNMTSLAKLRLILMDSEGSYIYEYECSLTPSEKWFDIQQAVYNGTGSTVAMTRSANCIETYYLTAGDYSVLVRGASSYMHKTHDLFHGNITLESGQVMNVTLASISARITLDLLDADDNYIYDKDVSCSRSPSSKWDDIRTYIYDEEGASVSYVTSTKCEEEYYLIPGTYRIVVDGKKESLQNRLLLYDNTITVAAGNEYTLSTAEMARIVLGLHDDEGNFLHARYSGCGLSPSAEWWDLDLDIYNGTGDLIAFSDDLGCSNYFSLLNGTYRMVAKGQKSSYQTSLPLYDRTISVSGGNVYRLDSSDVAMVTLTLRDAEGRYLHSRNAGCGLSPTLQWQNLYLYIFNGTTGELIANTDDLDCKTYFALADGSYRIQVQGLNNSQQEWLPIFDDTMTVTGGNLYATGTEDMARISLTIKDARGRFLYQKYAGCGLSPSKEWFDLYLSIYDGSGERIAYTDDVGCMTYFSVPAGSYEVVVEGRKTNRQYDMPLYRKTMALSGGMVYRLSTSQMSLIGLTLVDGYGRYIYTSGGGCGLSPSREWYSLYAYVYNGTGYQAADTAYMGCESEFGLPGGDYNLRIRGRETSSSVYTDVNDTNTYEEGHICLVTANVDTDEFVYDCFEIQCPGDANGDMVVDFFDLVAVGLAFGSQAGDGNWNPDADVVQDGVIDIFDLAAVGLNYGRTC
jgi:hypothetical protein